MNKYDNPLSTLPSQDWTPNWREVALKMALQIRSEISSPQDIVKCADIFCQYLLKGKTEADIK